MTIGIYALRFTGTDKVYIGQSTNIEKRYSEHKRNLVNGIHKVKLQAAYTEFGTPSLDIICECQVSELDSSETDAIQIFDSVVNGFNTLSKPGAPNVVGFNSVLAKCAKDTYLEICRLAAETDMLSKDIADALDTTDTIVYGIVSGRTHTWLKEEIPALYSAMLSRRERGTYPQRKIKDIQYLKSPQGDVLKVAGTYAEFAREYGLCSKGISRVLSGIRKSYKGWTLYTGTQV